MEKYQSYKPSGIEWIGEIPDNWSISKFKFLTKKEVQYGVNSSSDNYVESGIRFIRTTDILESGRLIEDGVYVEESTIPERQITELYDFLISRSGTLGRTYLHLNDDKYTYGGYLVRFNFGSENLSKFIDYYCKSTSFSNWINLNTIISTIGNVNGQKYNNMELPLPPLESIFEIVQFLDSKTELIDKLISTKERKITFLKEQRTSLINQVVTKGFNPNVKMKDSGVEWIGEIPEGWEVGKLKHNSELKISSVDKHIFDDEISVDVCNYTDVYYNEFISSRLQFRKGSCTPDEYQKFKLNKGDVIITKDSESPNDIGVPSIVIEDFDNLVCGYHLSIIKSNPQKLLGSFLFRQLQTTRIRSYFEINSNGITRFGLGKSSVLETPLVLPPILEQQSIVEYIESKTKEIDDLVQLEQKKIDLLKEYRQSLISEVVTGKIKVTTDE